jgi:hypothetical protein
LHIAHLIKSSQNKTAGLVTCATGSQNSVRSLEPKTIKLHEKPTICMVPTEEKVPIRPNLGVGK